MKPLPEYPWLQYEVDAHGWYRIKLPNGLIVRCNSSDCIHRLATGSTQADGYIPLGTRVRDLLKKVGINRQCAACIRRQRILDTLIRRGR